MEEIKEVKLEKVISLKKESAEEFLIRLKAEDTDKLIIFSDQEGHEIYDINNVSDSAISFINALKHDRFSDFKIGYILGTMMGMSTINEINSKRAKLLRSLFKAMEEGLQ